MLDTDTKRRIDTARDILVGKVPDPKSQVEQITIALIYKFMDDMDAESEEFGGKRKFFANEFAHYGWAKLMRSGLGGHETLNLYAEAIARMPENPGIPLLFRNIFKNAYLPYRDPETLKMFLKVIDEFNYDHSEKLGDAFEYLLSVLGSQGDAGQFRTPRHIIDFMVEIIDPKKNETMLDPACGTAGFLISSYKHILRANSVQTSPSTSSSPSTLSTCTLTPDEKGRLAQNFKGYDISPDMVRLSLVNMYLHGFADPHIFEYDTLTSQDRWNEYADVILANPPFMSPKGGIKPHNRFSVQSKRSEVLFVDYMAEHLTPNGRAGIIVPEGIIFQSQTAYKQLRKMLVEEHLVAVVSLPAGVFNPYSGVKTSILILDKSLARKTNTIAFFKIENDGFGLGAQRREIDKNDLPPAAAFLKSYFQSTLSTSSTTSTPSTPNALIVEKAKIAANGEYNLSGERYRENGVRLSVFPLRQFEDVCTLEYGASLPKEKRIDGPYPVVGSNGITGYHNEYLVEGPAIIVGRKGSAGEVTLIEQHCFPIDTTYYVKQTNPSKSNIVFLFWILKSLNLPDLRGGAGIPGLNRSDVYNTHQIPLPPLEVQKEIVAEIEGYQKVINGARAVLDNYRPHIPIHPDWPMVELGQHFATMSGGTPSKVEHRFWMGQIPWVSPKDMKADLIEDTEDHISEAAVEASATKLIPAGSVVCVVRSGILKHSFPVALLGGDMCINQDLIAFRPKTDAVISKFLFYVLKTRSSSIIEDGIKPGVTVQSFYNGFFRDYLIPLPPLATQQAIVAEIEAEQALVAANRELIARFEKKIQTTLARVWGEDELSQKETATVEGKK
ncbi:MAG: N-6 DNA methylase [Proteobacteria bacterium]|nr:N-6 DNA methylase [Pseudomonadota bacterium]